MLLSYLLGLKRKLRLRYITAGSTSVIEFMVTDAYCVRKKLQKWRCCLRQEFKENAVPVCPYSPAKRSSFMARSSSNGD